MSTLNRTNARMKALVAAEEGRLRARNYGLGDSLAGLKTGVSTAALSWAKRKSLVSSNTPAPRPSGEEPVLRKFSLTEAGETLLRQWRTGA